MNLEKRNELQQGTPRPHEAAFLKPEARSFFDAVRFTVGRYLVDLESQETLANRSAQISDDGARRKRDASFREMHT